MKIDQLAWVEFLRPIIDEYKDNSDMIMPLTKSEVQVLAKHIENKINLIEGNITYEQYEALDCNLIVIDSPIPSWLTLEVQKEVRRILELPESYFTPGQGNALLKAVKYLIETERVYGQGGHIGLKGAREIVDAIKKSLK